MWPHEQLKMIAWTLPEHNLSTETSFYESEIPFELVKSILSVYFPNVFAVWRCQIRSQNLPDLRIRSLTGNWQAALNRY